MWKIGKLSFGGRRGGPEEIPVGVSFTSTSRQWTTPMATPSPSDLEQIRKADVVIGVDEDFGNWFVLFGRDHLEQARLSNMENRTSIALLHVGPNSIPLEQVLDVVAKVKGQHDFVPDPTDLDVWVEEFLRPLHERGN
jgi:hypothetical protein